MVLVGAAVLGLGLTGAGVWAVASFLGTGAQPAEALPAGTLGYASIDLDPSGGQKLEALKTLKKFPAFEDNIGIGTKDDIREWVFEEFKKDSGCGDIDYATDVEPWLGDRAAVAAVDTGDDAPTPVIVLQVTDADRAETGLALFQECNGADEVADPDGGWVINGDWAVIAETTALAQSVADDAERSSLADDATYRKWTGEVGDSGIASFYAAPAAGAHLGQDFGVFGTSAAEEESGLSSALADFAGMAATVRFDGGAVELESAGDPGFRLLLNDSGGEMISTLPEDTAAALGLGLADGWLRPMVERFAASGGPDADELMRQMSRELDVDVPADIETLAGESLAVSVGSDFDLESFFSLGDGSGVPIATKVKGDPGAIEIVLEKLRNLAGSEVATLTASESEGDLISVGPDDRYRAAVLADGGLGDSDVFRDVVREPSAASLVVFVSFDAGGGWLERLVGPDPELTQNLAPLAGFGLSAWQDEDDTVHAVMRVTTD